MISELLLSPFYRRGIPGIRRVTHFPKVTQLIMDRAWCELARSKPHVLNRLAASHGRWREFNGRKHSKYPAGHGLSASSPIPWLWHGAAVCGHEHCTASCVAHAPSEGSAHRHGHVGTAPYVRANMCLPQGSTRSTWEHPKGCLSVGHTRPKPS